MRKTKAEYSRTYYAKNREKRNAESRAYHATNREKILAHKREKTYRDLGVIAGRPRPDTCEICDRTNLDGRPIYLDHDHKTGEFRGWLCHKCNAILAAADDDTEILDKLIVYLFRSRRPKLSVVA